MSSKLDSAEYDPVYRSLMKDVQDKSLLERSTQVQGYERRNKIKQLTELGQRFPSPVQQSNQDHLASDVFTRRVREYEASIKVGPSIHSAGSSVHRPGSSIHSAYSQVPASIKVLNYCFIFLLFYEQPVLIFASKGQSVSLFFTFF